MAQIVKGNGVAVKQGGAMSKPHGAPLGMRMVKGGSPSSHSSPLPHDQPITILTKSGPIGPGAAGLTMTNSPSGPIVMGPQPVLGTGVMVGAGVAQGRNMGATPVQMPAGQATCGGVSPVLPSQSQPEHHQQLLTSASAAAAGGVTLSNQASTNLANTKEKTPMCLINELARFNKIQHQYTLTDEQGPAHKKTFYVKLKLGEEEYSANGPSIKKAQHSAAAIALEQSQYKHPPPKPPRADCDGLYDELSMDPGNPSITPTVELNALAMKRGEPTIYTPIEPARAQFPYYPPNFDFRGMYHQRYHYPKYPKVFYVSLKVGQREFIGEGSTRQAARHSAAAKALKVLRVLPLPSDAVPKVATSDDEEDGEKDEVDEINTEGNQVDELKSEISLVHEIALKRNLQVNFEVTKESGPPHMRTFVTQCSCGNYKTDGEGNSKKLSKKRAAEKMLTQLQGLPIVTQVNLRPKKNINNKKKTRNLIKKADVDYGVGINPISRLIQIQQAKKAKEPVYSLIAERGMPRRREFVMQVTVEEQVCTGVGPNKKLAKRNAAENMLLQLGYSRPAPQPSKPAIKSGDSPLSTVVDKKVTFLDQDSVHTRQLLPGVLLMPEIGYSAMHGGVPRNSLGTMTDAGVKFSPQTTAAIAKELLDTGSSPTAEAISKSGVPAAASSSVVRPKQQLLYLAEVLGFQVQFTDFPKGNKNKSEFLSLVSLSTNPPQVSHGAGMSIDASHDMAALTALKGLTEMGLDVVADIKKEDGAGDGPHIKESS